MEPLIAPSNYFFLGFFPAVIFSLLIPVVGVGLFTYIMAKRFEPLYKAAPDHRLDNIPERIFRFLKYGMAQYKQPRYMLAGVIHIIIFAGFMILSIRSISLVIIGVSSDFVLPGFDGPIGAVYNFIKDYAATAVFFAALTAAIRRGVYKPKRYAVPEKYGKDHTAEAVFVCGMIMTLMVSESLFEAALIASGQQHGFLAPLTLVWVFALLLKLVPQGGLQFLHILSYYIHDITFFTFLCFLPLGKHFHVITSLMNVFLMRLKTGNIKPVKYGIADDNLDEIKSFGVKKLEDFTWKHILDFYSCADCGRCSDQCPANLVGRPLSPRFISIKARDLLFKTYPLKPDSEIPEKKPLIGSIYEPDEIWSCTTCGACEQECPICIEYIDKIVDLRRGMVDEGEVPQTLQKPLQAIGKRGNPWGKMEKKRADWAREKEFAAECAVPIFENGDTFETLYFVDSISSYDDRMMGIAKATAKILSTVGIDFGVLGKDEKDSGNEVRRFGEEMLFQDLKNHNTEMIAETGVKKIVTSDPHAFNALKNDYPKMTLPVEHISQVITRHVKSGDLKLKPIADSTKVYTYHDPCYLGRHNGIYDDPREALDAIPGLRRVEMAKYKDRSLCCSGGGLMLFYEPHEEERMSVLRVKMAAEAGANVIVTACPFCLVNMEDAIKVAGLDGQMEAIDLAELIEKHVEK